jgi:hypothetical protein
MSQEYAFTLVINQNDYNENDLSKPIFRDSKNHEIDLDSGIDIYHIK